MFVWHSAHFGSLTRTSLNFAIASSYLLSLLSATPCSNGALMAAISASAFLRVGVRTRRRRHRRPASA